VLVAVAFRVKFLTPKTALIVQIGMAILVGFASGKLIPMVIEWIVEVWPTHAGVI
jgi:hypothetical protein